MAEPYDEGFRARLAGKGVDANPYVLLAEQQEWSEGWRDQDEHLRDRDEAMANIGLMDLISNLIHARTALKTDRPEEALKTIRAILRRIDPKREFENALRARS